jgi:hypothetical protein
MYVIIEDGSHQFRVREGDRIQVDRHDGKAGDELVFSKVLFIAGGDGGATIAPPRARWPVRRAGRPVMPTAPPGLSPFYPKRAILPGFPAMARFSHLMVARSAPGGYRDESDKVSA